MEVLSVREPNTLRSVNSPVSGQLQVLLQLFHDAYRLVRVSPHQLPVVCVYYVCVWVSVSVCVGTAWSNCCVTWACVPRQLFC